VGSTPTKAQAASLFGCVSMKRPIRRCVECGVVLRYEDILAAGPFSCPNCGKKLQVSNRYGRWIGVGSLALSVGASLALGFRGLHLFYAVLLLLVVIGYFAIHLLKYVLPPKIGIAVPLIPLRHLVREIMGPTELNLTDKKRPQGRDHDA
jgi:predicted RNA-binding Zn-ribbon protein involved in translation (DUF1610 family)